MADLLRDEFVVARVAGAVNGTSAEPGPGTRTVTDTGNRLSINASGQVSITSGGAVGDPAIWESSIARAAGRMLFESVTVLSNANPVVGWDTNIAGTIEPYRMNLPASLYAALNNSAIVVGVVVAGTTYKVCIVLRAIGAMYFIKGGAFTNWTLLVTDVTNNTTPLYPAYGATGTHVGGVLNDFLRIPATLWLPTPLLSTSGAMTWPTTDGLGHAETTGLGSGGSGLTMLDAGTWSVAGGYMLNTPTLGPELAAGNLEVGKWYLITATEVDHFYSGCAINDKFRAAAATALDANNKVKLVTNIIANLQLSTTDVLAECVIHAFTLKNQCGMALNLDAAGTNGVLCYFDGAGNVKLDEVKNGVYTNRLNAAVAFVADKRLIVRKVGTEYRVFYNEALVGTTTSVDAAAMAGKYHGMFSTLAANTITSMVVYDTGNVTNSNSTLDTLAGPGWNKEMMEEDDD